ncbi:hypothetical protein GCM10009430_17790 [Aquimarina litoralis]|uniref:Natural product n=2 Tax=Aquimarina litoralis TaxID=584605 RepID=A0ABN1IQJ5_9FLAO
MCLPINNYKYTMNKQNKKKLTLDKIKIAKLDNLNNFKGGQQENTANANFEVYLTKLTICDTFGDCVSTKTIPISGHTCICL